MLYTRAKRLRRWRLVAVTASAVLLAAATLAMGAATAPIGVTGGVVVFFASLLQAKRESALVERAVAVQEKFDTQVFDLPWNAFAVPHQPTGHEVQEEAAKYHGRPTNDWYPDTQSVTRPLDVLICQQANLGWGTSIHLRWAATLVAVACALTLVLAAVWGVLHLDLWPALNALVVPFAPVLYELLDAGQKHRSSADDKRTTHRLLLDLWQAGLTRPIAEQRTRGVQDCIANLRRQNAQVPDWFDGHFRASSERAMRGAASDLIDEAKRHGKA